MELISISVCFVVPQYGHAFGMDSVRCSDLGWWSLQGIYFFRIRVRYRIAFYIRLLTAISFLQTFEPVVKSYMHWSNAYIYKRLLTCIGSAFSGILRYVVKYSGNPRGNWVLEEAWEPAAQWSPSRKPSKHVLFPPVKPFAGGNLCGPHQTLLGQLPKWKVSQTQPTCTSILSTACFCCIDILENRHPYQRGWNPSNLCLHSTEGEYSVWYPKICSYCFLLRKNSSMFKTGVFFSICTTLLGLG